MQLQRTEIAQRAAKLVVEEHIHDFAQAKRKAAKQLGINDRNALPSNDEIESALGEYRQLYDPEHALLLQTLREKAAYLLEFFAAFRPYLYGSVLNGRAGAHSNINLQLFHDDPKSVELFLLNQRIQYDIVTIPGVRRYEDYPVLAFWFDDTPVRVQLQPSSAERNPQHKAEKERINLAGLKRLLANGSTAQTSTELAPC
ncbi:hypothetical protein [Chitinilyticum litopenaei]|uniref:hypothetical protein n=1 Tax=Chitinilyticum litopenaei TaxID=1121276 RepID=UPI0004295A55|nr:hypothetical protein [Chitinilyticum litopenaei]